MKGFVVSALLLLLGFVNVNHAQESSFEWTDSVFVIEAKKEIQVVGFSYDKWFMKDVRNQPIIDTICSFLNNMPQVKINILIHSDERGSFSANQVLTQRFSEIFYRNLMTLGIDKNRITPIGMGENQPLVPIEEIEKLKSKEEKEKAHARNRRVEIQIAEI